MSGRVIVASVEVVSDGVQKVTIRTTDRWTSNRADVSDLPASVALALRAWLIEHPAFGAEAQR